MNTYKIFRFEGPLKAPGSIDAILFSSRPLTCIKNTQVHSQDMQIVHNEAPAQTILTSILECTLCISRCCNNFPHLHKHQAEKSLKSSPTESHYMHVLMRRHPEIKLSLSSCLAEYSLPDCSDIQGEDLQLLCHSSTIGTLLCLIYSMHLGTLWALSN